MARRQTGNEKAPEYWEVSCANPRFFTHEVLQDELNRRTRGNIYRLDT